MNKNLISIILFISIMFSLSCEKIEGEGGTSTISGKVYAYEYNKNGELVDQYYAADQDVYIIYGENSDTYDDKFATSYDGSFEFKYLQQGYYKIFVYSQCDTCSGEIEVISTEVNISENYKEYVLEDLVIKK